MTDLEFIQQAMKFVQKEILLGRNRNDCITYMLIKNLDRDRDKLQNSTYAHKMIDGGVSSTDAILKALYCCYHQCEYAGDAIIALNKYGEDGVLDRLSEHCSLLHIEIDETLRIWTDTYITMYSDLSDTKHTRVITGCGQYEKVSDQLVNMNIFINSKAIYFKLSRNGFVRVDTEGNVEEINTAGHKLADKCLMLDVF